MTFVVRNAAGKVARNEAEMAQKKWPQNLYLNPVIWVIKSCYAANENSHLNCYLRNWFSKCVRQYQSSNFFLFIFGDGTVCTTMQNKTKMKFRHENNYTRKWWQSRDNAAIVKGPQFPSCRVHTYLGAFFRQYFTMPFFKYTVAIHRIFVSTWLKAKMICVIVV